MQRLLIDTFDYSRSSTLKLEVTCSSETSVDFQRTTRSYTPEDRTLNYHSRRESKILLSLLATCFYTGFLLGLFFDSENGGDMFLRNIGWLSAGYMALYPRRWYSSYNYLIQICMKYFDGYVLRSKKEKYSLHASVWWNIYSRLLLTK
jgi:hypothetical protein